MYCLMEVKRIVRHKATISPFECYHCGVIWYGMAGSENEDRPPDTVLCVHCHNALWNYLYYDGPHCKNGAEVNKATLQQISGAWIADKTKKPFPRNESKRFERSVPRWMRRAIDLGLVKPNDKDVYIISTAGEEPVRIDKEETYEAFHERLSRNEKPFKKKAVPFWQAKSDEG